MFTNTPGFTQRKFTQFQTYGILKKYYEHIFQCAQQYECGRRVLLGENTGGTTVMLGPFQFVRIWL
jgi:hypothetical protein